MAIIKISCETQDAKIMYTTDDSEPTESSNLYSDIFEVDSPVTIKARAFKEGYEPSDITRKYVPFTVPMALPDGSVLFYDRGEAYGEYHIGSDGYPVRNDGAVDDGTAESKNWRYLICDKSDLDGRKHWGPYGTLEGITNSVIGAGLENTNHMIATYPSSDDYWWKSIVEKKDNTGLNWFMPSRDELDLVYNNKDVITSNGGVAFKNYYWASSEGTKDYAGYRNFSDGTKGTNSKFGSNYCRLIRRI